MRKPAAARVGEWEAAAAAARVGEWEAVATEAVPREVSWAGG